VDQQPDYEAPEVEELDVGQDQDPVETAAGISNPN
jgi:hypothetical protein